ncbi:MAG: TetR/AcrR family transcriptional regulator [Bacilli bacterium]|nr:TetR/AcrR family transcriptional regulator [Bacilli bacterium]
MDSNVRNPKQKRAIEKKTRIIDAGFELICENGYYNTNTAEIAKKANVSTGIIYQYFKDKHDIFIEAINKYGDDIFFPMIDESTEFDIDNFESTIRSMIEKYVHEHKVSRIAHEEIMAMVHSDSEVADYYYKREIELTQKIKELLIDNNFKDDNLYEKVHVMIGMIDNLCHEIIYHRHEKMNYDIMTDVVINSIEDIFKNDLNV